MGTDELLDKLDDLVDKAWGLPLSGGRCVVDAERVREIIDDLRLNIPKEIPQAKAIVSDRMEIIKNAKNEADGIIKKAQDKAQYLISSSEITRQATDKANAMLKDAQDKSKEMKKAAADFSDHLLIQSEESITQALQEIKQARQALKTPSKI